MKKKLLYIIMVIVIFVGLIFINYYQKKNKQIKQD